MKDEIRRLKLTLETSARDLEQVRKAHAMSLSSDQNEREALRKALATTMKDFEDEKRARALSLQANKKERETFRSTSKQSRTLWMKKENPT